MTCPEPWHGSPDRGRTVTFRAAGYPPTAMSGVDGPTERDIIMVISEVGVMPDILVRDIDPATLARIDAAAQRTGVSRNVLLRELLARYAEEQESGELTDEQVEAFGSSVRDLLDDDARVAAWRR